MHTKIEGGGEIEVFKILNGYENIDSNIYFKWKELIEKTTGVYLSRLDLKKYSLSQRIINRLDTGERAE